MIYQYVDTILYVLRKYIRIMLKDIYMYLYAHKHTLENICIYLCIHMHMHIKYLYVHTFSAYKMHVTLVDIYTHTLMHVFTNGMYL
jgi:hypothetical protein